MPSWFDDDIISPSPNQDEDLFCDISVDSEGGLEEKDDSTTDLQLSNVHRHPEPGNPAQDDDGEALQLSNVCRAADILFPDAEVTIWETEEKTCDIIQSNVIRRPDITLEASDSSSTFHELSIKPHKPHIEHMNQRMERKELVDLERFIALSLKLMVYQQQLCIFEPPFWRKLDVHSAKVTIRGFLEQHDLASHLTDSDLGALYKLLLVNTTIQRRERLTPPEFMLNLSDCTLDVRSSEVHCHDPEDFFFSYINVSYRDIQSVKRKGTTFEQFVRDISDGDYAMRQQLLELTALALTGYETKHFFVLLGPSNTGKTQFGRFLEELVGRDYVETLRGVADFGERFALGVLEGKKLVTCLDLPDAPLGPGAIGMIKQMVGDDPVKGERKYRDPITFYKKPLLLFAGNYAIQIPKVSREQALLNRMVIIPFSNPKEAHEMRLSLYKELLNEAPYIVGEAIKAFQQLMNRNFQITRSHIPEEYQTVEAREIFNAVLAFFCECCVVTQEGEISTENLFEAYVQYTIRRSLEQTNQTNFSRTFAEVLRQERIEVDPVKRTSGSGQRGYRGITLKGF